MSFISFDKVSKIYQMGEVEIKALDEISFDIEQGEFVVVLGSSGAGKTRDPAAASSRFFSPLMQKQEVG